MNSTATSKKAKMTITVPELAEELNIGRNAAYELCHTQGFPAIQIGKRLVIPVEPLRDWLRAKGLEQNTYDGF